MVFIARAAAPILPGMAGTAEYNHDSGQRIVRFQYN